MATHSELRGFWGTPVRWLTGAALHPLERRLVKGRRESPTTELLLFRPGA